MSSDIMHVMKITQIQPIGLSYGIFLVISSTTYSHSSDRESVDLSYVQQDFTVAHIYVFIVKASVT